MAKIEVELLDRTRSRARHPESGTELLTDIGRVWGGGGSSFSSTDLVAAALGTCIASSLSPIALREGIPLEGVAISVEKELATDPKRVDRLAVEVRLPAETTDQQLLKLSRAAHTCTVHRTLEGRVEMPIVVHRAPAEGAPQPAGAPD